MEKKLNISAKFREVLMEIKDTSEIAQLLIAGIPNENLPKDPVDYISISESDPTKISYLNEERIQLIQKLGEDIWTSKRRYHCKPGSFVSKVLKGVSAKSVETFSNQYKSHLYEKQFSFKIVSGGEIPKNYIFHNYQSQSGSLGASCMKYEKCESYFGIYENNPQVKMLIMTSHNGFVMGRALLWEFESGGKTWKVMDRIYTIKDEDFSHFFKKWGIENGYIWKSHQNWGNTLQFVDKDGDLGELKLDIQLEDWEFDYYPYLDTFKWFDSKKGTLHNYLPSHFVVNDSRFQLLTLPDGKGENCDYLVFDDIDRKWMYKSEAIRIEDHNIITNGENCTWSETLNKYILKSEAAWDPNLDDYIYKDVSKIDPILIENRKKFLSKHLKSKDLLFEMFRSGFQNQENPPQYFQVEDI